MKPIVYIVDSEGYIRVDGRIYFVGANLAGETLCRVTNAIPLVRYTDNADEEFYIAHRVKYLERK
jgi:hypothetical protein